jgi:hypothetical protein
LAFCQASVAHRRGYSFHRPTASARQARVLQPAFA